MKIFMLTTLFVTWIYRPSDVVVAAANVVCNATACGPKRVGAYLCADNHTISRIVCAYNSTSKKCQYGFTKCPPVCTAAKCGTKPVIDYLCPDLKTVVSVGSCAYNSTTKKCAYTFKQCPKSKNRCTPAACGKPLIGSVYPCSDGVSFAHNGPCVYNTTLKKCLYTKVPCPKYPNCTAANCGKKPDSTYLCPDHTTVVKVGSCGYNNVTKKCVYTYKQCPNSTNLCTPADCGQRPNGTILCRDGVTYAHARNCYYDATATKKCDYIYDCPM